MVKFLKVRVIYHVVNMVLSPLDINLPAQSDTGQGFADIYGSSFELHWILDTSRYIFYNYYKMYFFYIFYKL